MKTNNILRNSIIGGLFLLPFIVLIVSNNFFFPFITGKNFAFRIIVEIITALWLILGLRDRSVLPKLGKIFWAFLAFIVVMFVSDLFSPNVFKSFWSNFERMEGWVTLVHLFALFVVASSVMTRKLWDWLFRVSVFISLLISFYGIMQLSGKLAIHQGGVRLDATFGNATYLAVYMLFHIFLCLILWFRTEKGSFWKWFYGIAIVAETFILYHTATRGATLGLLGGLFLTALLIAIFDKANITGTRKVAIGGILGLLVLVGTFWIARDSVFVAKSPVLQRFAGLSLTDKTADSRFRIWGMAFQGFKERPILGWGQESFNYVFNTNYDPKLYGSEQWFDRTHNVFFDWLVAGGILGLIAYLSLFGLPIYYLWRRGSPFPLIEKSLLTGLFAGYFFHNLTVFDNITSYLFFIFVIAYIHSETHFAPSEKILAKVGAIDEGIKNRVIIPIVIAVLAVLIYVVNVPSMLSASALIKALSSQTGGPAVNLGYYKKALAYGGLGDSEIREQVFQIATQATTVSGIDPKIREDFFDLAEAQMKIQLERTPKDARYFLYAGTFLASYGDYDRAVTYLSTAHDLSKKKQTILFSLGSAYFGKGDYKSAVAVFKEAFDLEPSFEEARKLYATALIYNKQGDLAEEILKPIKPTEVIGNDRFILAYYTGGYYDKALQGAEVMVKNDPNNPQVYYTRAVIEVAMRRTSAAIADLKKVAELNPQAKTQVDALIAQVQAGKGI